MAETAEVKIFIRVFKEGVKESIAEVNRGFQNLQVRMMKVFFTVQGLQSGFSVLKGAFGGLIAEANKLAASNRKLEATAKLTGASLNTLKDVSRFAKQEFKLSTEQANEFTIALTKLGQKAGDTSQTAEAIGRLLDLAAAQGLSAEEALVAINQAILGIDEGTDKLFQKNPSQIYKEYAQQIGKTVGQLSDQEKAQALLNAVMEDGAKVQGTYQQYLKDSQGAQDQFTTAMEETKASLGSILAEALTPFLQVFRDVLNWFKKSPTWIKSAAIAVGGLTTAMIALNVSLGPVSLALTALSAVGLGLISHFQSARTEADNFAESLSTLSIKSEKAAQLMALGRLTPLREELEEAKTKWEQTLQDIEDSTQVHVQKIAQYARQRFDLFEPERAVLDLRNRFETEKASIQDWLLKWKEVNAVLKGAGKEQVSFIEYVKGLREDALRAGNEEAVLQYNNVIITYQRLEALNKILQVSEQYANKSKELQLAEEVAAGKFDEAARKKEQHQQQSIQLNETEIEKQIALLELEKQRASTITDAEQRLQKEHDITAQILQLKLKAAQAKGDTDEVAKIRLQLNLLDEKLKVEKDILKVRQQQEQTARLEQLQQETEQLVQQEQMLQLRLQELQELATAETEEEKIRIRKEYALKRLKLEEQQALDELAIQYKGLENTQEYLEAKLALEREYATRRKILEGETNVELSNLTNQRLNQEEQAYDEFIGIMSTAYSDFFTSFLSMSGDMERQQTQIWENLKRRFMQFVAAQIAQKIKLLVVHKTTETAKTTITKTQTATRSSISIGAILKEGWEALKSVGKWIATIAVKLFSWFASKGPIGIALGFAAVPAIVYAVKSAIRGLAKFQKGGIVTRETLGVIGEAGDSEAVIPLNQRGAEFIAKMLPKIVVPPKTGSALRLERLESLVADLKKTMENLELSTRIDATELAIVVETGQKALENMDM